MRKCTCQGMNTLSGEVTLSKLFEKRSTLKGKNFLPFGRKFFPFIVDLFLEGSQTSLDRVASYESVSHFDDISLGVPRKAKIWAVSTPWNIGYSPIQRHILHKLCTLFTLKYCFVEFWYLCYCHSSQNTIRSSRSTIWIVILYDIPCNEMLVLLIYCWI